MNYVVSLNEDQLKDIALYLNFDMVASPNPGYFTYDGDQSLPTGSIGSAHVCPRGRPASNVPWWLISRGPETPPKTQFEGRSRLRRLHTCRCPRGLAVYRRRKGDDRRAGRAVGRRGGPAVRSEHPYQKTDTLEHIDRTALEINGGRCRLCRRDLRARPRRPQRCAHPRCTVLDTCSRIHDDAD